MTNRDYINSLNNEELAHFIYHDAITIGLSYNDSIQGLTKWLSEERVNDGK